MMEPRLLDKGCPHTIYKETWCPTVIRESCWNHFWRTQKCPSLLNTQLSFPARYSALAFLQRPRKLKELSDISQAVDLMIATPFNTSFVEDPFLKKGIKKGIKKGTSM